MLDVHVSEPIVIRADKGTYIATEEVCKKIRATFHDLAHYDEHKFNSMCSEFAVIRGEDSYIKPKVPCLEAAVIKLGFTETCYILFFMNGKLMIGYDALSIKYVNHVIKAEMRTFGSNFYCSGGIEF